MFDGSYDRNAITELIINSLPRIEILALVIRYAVELVGKSAVGDKYIINFHYQITSKVLPCRTVMNFVRNRTRVCDGVMAMLLFHFVGCICSADYYEYYHSHVAPSVIYARTEKKKKYYPNVLCSTKIT